MTHELIEAFFLIFIAEMGDKTQILAMAFATRFPVKKVLFGIFIGAFLNHGLAVLLGSYISNFVPINTLQIIAGVAFVCFSLWTLKGEEEEENDEKQKIKFGPVFTVAFAFFVGELGDKTQLSAITLATKASYPLAILAGTVCGMIVTGAIGIFVGKKLGDKIPEFTIKMLAASIFMFFGLTKLYQTLPAKFLTVPNMIIFLILLATVVIMILRPVIINRKQGNTSLLRQKAKELFQYYQQIEGKIERVCLGENKCGTCQGNNCIIGNTKTLIQNGKNEPESIHDTITTPNIESIKKNYNKEQVLDSLRITVEIIKKNHIDLDNHVIHTIRRNFEMILFGTCMDEIKDWSTYSNWLTELDEISASKVIEVIDKN